MQNEPFCTVTAQETWKFWFEGVKINIPWRTSILTPKNSPKQSGESENTQIMFPEPSHSGEMCFPKGRDAILPYLYFWYILSILKTKVYMCFSCKKYTFQTVRMNN